MHFCLRAPTPRLQFLEREKLSQVYCGKKEDFSRTLVRIESFFKSHLTAVMRGFLFPLSCVDRLLFHSGHVSKVAGRCHKERLGLRVARAFTSKLQEALLATGITEKPDPGPIGPDPNGPDPCRIPMHIHVTDNRSGILTTGYLLFVHIRAYFLDLKLPEV